MTKALHIAPLMRYSDAHFRVLLHAIAPHAITYTEMATPNELLHHSRKACAKGTLEGPVILQLGGSDPQALAACIPKIEAWGYEGINLNVGCPSLKVMAMEAGVCLMKKPALVRDCVMAMRQQTDLPISVKTRIGIDHDDSFAFLSTFIATVMESGCTHFTIHARKAWTHGISPKQNRSIPPLHYQRVLDLKEAYPDLSIIINGGLRTMATITPLLSCLDGIMLGRLAIEDPWAIRIIHDHMCGSVVASKQAVLQHYLDYCHAQHQQGVHARMLLRHLFGFVSGQAGAKAWRRCLQLQMQSNSIDSKALLAFI